MIRIKHLLFITLVVFCISICYFCLSYYQEFRRYAEQNVGRELYMEEAFVANNIKTLVQHAVEVTHFTAGRESVESAMNGRIDQMRIMNDLAVIRSRAPIVEDVLLVDDAGRTMARITDNPLRFIPTSSSQFTEAFENIAERTGDFQNVSGDILFADTRDELGGEILSMVYVHPVVAFDPFQQVYDVKGFLVANIPVIKLISEVSSLSNTGSLIRISNKFLYDLDGYLSRFQTLDIRTINSQLLCTLRVSVSIPADQIETSLLDSIVSQVKKNVFISSLIALALIICFLFILHSFGQLFAFINRLEMNNKIYSEKFVIWEFNKTARLLHDMKNTILSQLRDIERKNLGLERANNETAEVNRKLADMNATLERQVKERTISLQNALELSNKCNNISNVIINQRTMLKDELKPGDIFAIFCESLREFNLKRNFCFEYKMEGESREKLNTITTIVPAFDNIPAGDSYNYEKGFYRFPLTMKEGDGMLVVESQNSAIEPDILTAIAMFCREVSSYLDNRALRNRLSFWARTDGLTKLGNRVAYDQQMAYFETCLDSEIGLFLIDANGLKEINDSRGHTAGDALLKKVAGKLRTVFDGYDADIFRIGGDEFITLLHGKDLNNAQEIIQKLAEIQDKPVPRSATTAEISATFAVGYADSRTTPFQQLYKKADHEMYLQKEAYYEMRHRLFGEIRAPRH